MEETLQQICLQLATQEPGSGLAHLLDLKQEAEISLACDLAVIQESFRFRTVWRARKIANILLCEEGVIKKEALTQLIALFEHEGHLFYPAGYSDGVVRDHILRTLKAFRDRPHLSKLLMKFRLPLCHRFAEKIVKESMTHFHSSELTERMLRSAVLSSCFVYLRQNVGSCFATAPAILIQEEQLELLLQDLYDVLTTGVMKRTFGGVEYAVPLSPSTGMGDLRKSLLIADRHAQVWYSPGLMAALRCTRDQLKHLLAPHLEKGISFTAEDFIHQALLSQFNLTEEDLRRFKASQKFLVKGAEPLSKKGELCLKMLDRETEARAAFKSITDHALLKAWEFTIASFSEVKMEFSKWNLYSSLGLNHEEEGGIGALIYRHLDEKLEDNNEKVGEYQRTYEIAYDQLRATETLLKQASTEGEIRRLRAEFQSRLYHMQSCLEMRDRAYSAASQYSSLYSFLLKQYEEKIPEYFQEIYDAQMQDVQTSSYEDSPAGFRLVYKHGRTDPSVWTLIFTADQYIEALSAFFLATEHAIIQACEWSKGREEIGRLTSLIVSHLRTPDFLRSAIQRMAKAHHLQLPLYVDVLTALEQLEKKPWAYTSGGTLETLLNTYFRRDRAFTQEERRVENETDLLIFIIDALKNLPPSVADPFRNEAEKGMLMHSPTHAFILRPGFSLLKTAWEDDLFTYTWVRDQIIQPMQDFFSAITLTPEEQLFLIEEFSDQLPSWFGHRLRHAVSLRSKGLSVPAFRNQVLQEASTLPFHPQALADGLDAFLWQMLPLSAPARLEENVCTLLGDHAPIPRKLSVGFTAPFISARQLKACAKAQFLSSHLSLCHPFDLHRVVADNAARARLAAPQPLLIADTNWANAYFGFVVNPGTLKLELWHFDYTATEGVPMSSWSPWFNEKKLALWSILARPYEYTGISL